MIYNEILPVKKFIMTDILGQNNGYKYTNGYIYRVQSKNLGPRHYLSVLCIITRSGKTGKLRIQQKELYVCPLVIKELIGKSELYDGIGHILTKLEKKDVLMMSNFEFLSWAYANILHLESHKINHVWPGVYDETIIQLKRLAQKFHKYDPELENTVVSIIEVRKSFLHRLHLAQIFIKEPIKKESTNCNLPYLLLGHIDRLDTVKFKNLNTSLKNYYNKIINEEKLPEELLMENKNVLHEYESSGYWD